MVDHELLNSAEFESVVSKVEMAVRNKEPLAFNPDDALILKSSFEESGIRFYTSKEATLRLMRASMLRVKVVLEDTGQVSGVTIYDYEKPEGQRWTKLQEFNPANFVSEKFGDDKSVALYEMLGAERFGDLTKWCYQQATAADYPGKIGGFEGTEGRGLLQAAADLLAIAHEQGEEVPTKIFTERLNRRLWKGFKKTLEAEDAQKVGTKFREAEVEEPSKTLASFPPDALPKLIRFLAQR